MYPKRAFVMAAAACLLALAGTVPAAPVYWADWTEAANPGAVIGTITGAGPDPVGVTYTGGYVFANVSGGPNYWSPESTFADGSIVDNGPTLKDIIALEGGGSTVHTLAFSQPVVNPVMGIVSLGQRDLPVTYSFDAPFDIITNGPGAFGNGPLAELVGQTLEGREGHGTIQFQGTFSEIHWTIPTAEYWHGFTVGIGSIDEEDGEEDGDDHPGPAPIPAPGALLLGSLGTILIGYLRRRAVL